MNKSIFALLLFFSASHAQASTTSTYFTHTASQLDDSGFIQNDDSTDTLSVNPISGETSTKDYTEATSIVMSYNNYDVYARARADISGQMSIDLNYGGDNLISYFARGGVVVKTNIINDTTDDMQYTYSMNIASINLALGGFELSDQYFHDNGKFYVANYISLEQKSNSDTTTLFDSYTRLDKDLNGLSFNVEGDAITWLDTTLGGHTLNYFDNSGVKYGASYESQPFSKTFNLGVLAPGESMEVSYLIYNYLRADGPVYYSSDGGLIAKAIIYDPVGVNASTISSSPVSAVPLPNAVLLFGSGLLGLFGIKKRKS